MTIRKFWSLIRVERNSERLTVGVFTMAVINEATAKEKAITEMSKILLAFIKSCLLNECIISNHEDHEGSRRLREKLIKLQ